MEKNRSGKRVCKTEGDPVGWGQQVKIGRFWGRELLGKNGDRFPPRQSEEGGEREKGKLTVGEAAALSLLLRRCGLLFFPLRFFSSCWPPLSFPGNVGRKMEAPR